MPPTAPEKRSFQTAPPWAVISSAASAILAPHSLSPLIAWSSLLSRLASVEDWELLSILGIRERGEASAEREIDAVVERNGKFPDRRCRRAD